MICTVHDDTHGAGGDVVCIYGVDMYDDTAPSDVTDIYLGTVHVRSIHNMTTNSICVVSQSSPSPVIGHAVIHTMSRGTITSDSTYTYPPTGVITSVTPHMCTTHGGCRTVIKGRDLFYDMHDVHSVTFGSVNAVIESVNKTGNYIVVMVPANKYVRM